MSRWEPDATGRLQRAALELYSERGYERTTVAEIAERAGLTERTFFRHFADKREVLFRGSELMCDLLLDATRAAPEGSSALEAVGGAVTALTSIFSPERRPFAVARHAVISANPELQERELIKRASNVAAVTEALRERGESRPTAQLAAEAGMTVLHVAFERWVQDPEQRTYASHARHALEELRVVCGAQADGRGQSRPGSVAGLDGPRRVA